MPSEKVWRTFDTKTNKYIDITQEEYDRLPDYPHFDSLSKMSFSKIEDWKD